MKTKQIADLYAEYCVPVYNRLGIAAKKASGSWVWDEDGNKYLDLFPGWGVGALGHCHPYVVKKTTEQLKNLIHVPNTFYHAPHALLGKELIGSSFPGKIFLVSTGAEAVEAVIKLARKFGKGERYEIITMEKSFHGRTMGALAATGQPKHQKDFHPMLPGFTHVPYNDLGAVERAVTPKTVAVMVELVQGEGGVYVASPEYVKGLRKLCDDKNLLLIFDEISTGGGRTGTLFSYQAYGVTPDVMLLAKGIAGGLPLGILVAGKHVSDIWEKASHATTFGGNPLAAAAGLATLEAIKKEKLVANVKKQGAYLVKKLNGLKKKFSVIKEIRGKGLMLGIELTKPGAEVVKAAFRRKLLINCSQETVLRLYPALNVTAKELDLGLKIIEESLKEVFGS